jgi:hypothetical protein
MRKGGNRILGRAPPHSQFLRTTLTVPPGSYKIPCRRWRSSRYILIIYQFVHNDCSSPELIRFASSTLVLNSALESFICPCVKYVSTGRTGYDSLESGFDIRSAYRKHLDEQKVILSCGGSYVG